MKQKILFLCMMGRDRSKKAMQIINEDFKDKFEAKCAGVSEIADIPLTKQAIDWSDRIICMERRHRDALFERFPEARQKDVPVWDISSDYSWGDPELEKELRERINLIEENFS